MPSLPLARWYQGQRVCDWLVSTREDAWTEVGGVHSPGRLVCYLCAIAGVDPKDERAAKTQVNSRQKGCLYMTFYSVRVLDSNDFDKAGFKRPLATTLVSTIAS